MKANKAVLILAGAVVVSAAAATIYHVKMTGTAASGRANVAPAGTLQPQAAAPATPQAATPSGPSGDTAETTTSFLGGLKAGGTPEAAGAERNYVVTYQVAFLRKSPQEKLREESQSYKELIQSDATFAPYVFYGEVVTGKYDPAHPDSIAVHAKIDKKDVQGYIDSQKLWLEPAMAAAETPRYMALKEDTAIHVVPDAGSPAVLSILQGEVVEAVGKLNLQGAGWIKARFSSGDRPRFGFIQASDLQALTLANVNQSTVATEEIPKQIRASEISLKDADRQMLSKNGFYIEAIPAEPQISVDDMSDAYQTTRYGTQYFVTSDLFLHAHHLIFDRMLQDSEENRLAPSVAKLASNVAKVTESELKALPAAAPAEVRDGLRYDLLYFSVAAKLFDPEFAVSSSVRGEVETYVKNIELGGGQLPTAESSKFGDEDFTQYKVRGHYEKSDTLKRYFRGMMWFGRRNFLLSDKKLTVAAILIPGLVEKSQESRTFETIDHLLGYLIGQQDKYSLAGYRAMNKKIFGTEIPSPIQVSVKLDESLQAYSGAVVGELPGPRIVSQQTGRGMTPEERLKKVGGFKFLGQRYTLDAFFLNQLSSPNVGSDDNPRNLPSALDVMMLLGSKAATEEQQQAQQRAKWANYEAQTKKLQGVTQESLTKPATFYDEWLSAVNALYLPAASKQFFTLGRPWQYKNLNAGAASWTELKHDTILYTEQSSAEMGDGEEFYIPPYDPPKPKGYVEPNPLFFRREGQAIDQMLERLKRSEFITDEYLDKFTKFRELVRAAGDIAQKEVDGGNITAKEYGWIETLANSFGRELLWPRGADMAGDVSQLQMALVADVATDALGGRVLEVGTGTPQRILVVVKDAYGGTRLTVGYVYSWFEFASKKRWTDAEWKKVIYSEDSEGRKNAGIATPDWYSMFLKNPAGAN